MFRGEAGGVALRLSDQTLSKRLDPVGEKGASRCILVRPGDRVNEDTEAK